MRWSPVGTTLSTAFSAIGLPDGRGLGLGGACGWKDPDHAVRRIGAPGVADPFLPWIHYGVSQEHTTWSRDMPNYSIEQELPDGLKGFGSSFDELQQWLFRHGVGMRHQHHKVFSEFQMGQLPDRETVAEALNNEVNPVVVVTSAGIAGWQFIDAHVIDVFGLNDYVVARTPQNAGERSCGGPQSATA